MLIFQSQHALRRSLHINRMLSVVRNLKNVELESKYSDQQKNKILKVINENDVSLLSRYSITKARIKHISQWVSRNGQLESISDVELIEGFSQKLAQKFFDSILDESGKGDNLTKKIKGQILQPALNESKRQHCRSVLAVYITVNSVCWTHINTSSYEVLDWKYYSTEQQNDKKMHLPHIFSIVSEVIKHIPTADIYVMKAEATTLRATGSDPNNPKMLSINLQKSQMIAMIVALLNSRKTENDETKNEKVEQKVHFLRPTLPFRLYGTLVGNERVSTDQTVECLLQETGQRSRNNSKVHISEDLKTMFRSQKELQKDMLGQCLLLALTFMDICIYRNVESIQKLLKRGE